VEELFIRALGRKASDAEMKKMMDVAGRGDKAGYDDVLWALVNSTEFEFNH
jgi:hypothetical protein